jgi:hypothetical protein
MQPWTSLVRSTTEFEMEEEQVLRARSIVPPLVCGGDRVRWQGMRNYSLDRQCD